MLHDALTAIGRVTIALVLALVVTALAAGLGVVLLVAILSVTNR